jgi:signal peptide peptidase SppA
MSPAIRFLSNQVWAIHPPVFDALVSLLRRHEAGEKAENTGATVKASREQAPVIDGEFAIVPVRGVLARYADQINGACQDAGRSAESLQRDLLALEADPNIKTIVLQLDTPGGTVAGTAETGDVIRSLSKHTIAFVDGQCASAGYWLASQCDEIVIGSSTSEVGSIGVITAYVDATKAQDKEGYKVQVFRTAALKAPGAMGESLNAEQIASITSRLADFDGAFQDAVQSGRGLTDEQLKAATTGEMFIAEQAIRMGLADRIATLAQLLGKAPAVHGQTVANKVMAQADAAKEEAQMPISVTSLAALSKRYPAHSALILEESAKEGATDQTVQAAVHAAEESAAKAKADAIAAELEQTKQALAAEQAKAKYLEAKLAKFEQHAPKHKDPGADDSVKNGAKKITREEFAKDQAKYADDVRQGKIIVVEN